MTSSVKSFENVKAIFPSKKKALIFWRGKQKNFLQSPHFPWKTKVPLLKQVITFVFLQTISFSELLKNESSRRRKFERTKTSNGRAKKEILHFVSLRFCEWKWLANIYGGLQTTCTLFISTSSTTFPSNYVWKNPQEKRNQRVKIAIKRIVQMCAFDYA